MSKAKKDYLQMTAEELAEETQEFDAGAIPPGRPLRSDLRARWERARKGGTAAIPVSSPRPGNEKADIPAKVEGALLRRAIARAAKLKLKHSEYFAKALQLLTDGQAQVADTTIKVVATDSHEKTTK